MNNITGSLVAMPTRLSTLHVARHCDRLAGLRGWQMLTCLSEENRRPRWLIEGRRPRLADDDRRQLAARAYRLGDVSRELILKGVIKAFMIRDWTDTCWIDPRKPTRLRDSSNADDGSLVRSRAWGRCRSGCTRRSTGSLRACGNH